MAASTTHPQSFVGGSFARQDHHLAFVSSRLVSKLSTSSSRYAGYEGYEGGGDRAAFADIAKNGARGKKKGVGGSIVRSSRQAL